MFAGGSRAAGTSFVCTRITRPMLSSSSISPEDEPDKPVPAAKTVPAVATAITRNSFWMVWMFNWPHSETASFRGNQNPRLIV
jgi:hypothetical protein